MSGNVKRLLPPRQSRGNSSRISVGDDFLRAREANACERLGASEVGHAREALPEQLTDFVSPIITFDEPPQGRTRAGRTRSLDS
jgi:hypothetical protein